MKIIHVADAGSSIESTHTKTQLKFTSYVPQSEEQTKSIKPWELKRKEIGTYNNQIYFLLI